MLHEKLKVLTLGGPSVMSRTKLRERILGSYDDPRLIIDLSGVHLLEADVLSELLQLRLHRAAQGLQRGRLVVDSHYVRNALSAVGLDRNWPIYRTIEAAITSFR